MAGKSDNVFRLKTTELDKLLSGSVIAKNKGSLDKFIMDMLQSSGEENFSVPVAQRLFETIKGFQEKFIKVYKNTLVFGNLEGVDPDIMAMQGLLFDGLCFGVNMDKDNSIALYTANTKAVFGVDNMCKFSIDKTVEKNREGILHAVRIDVSYTSESGFEYKAVTLNKNTCLRVYNFDTGEGNFLIIPYMYVARSFALFDTLLSQGRVLKVIQEKGSFKKTRYISTRASVLSKYSDVDITEDVKVEYFPLKGFFYAPVLGSPALSVGRTRIDILSICYVMPVLKPKVEKANSMDSFSEELALMNILTDLYENNIEEYERVVAPIAKKSDSDCPSVHDVLGYLRELPAKSKEKYLSGVEGYNKLYGSYREAIKGYSRREVTSVEDLRELLKTSVCRVTVRKKDCLYSSMTVTNNTNVLKAIYGDDYFGKYESFGVRLYKLENLLDNNVTLQDAAKYCGMEDLFDSDEKKEKVLDLVKNGSDDPSMNTHEALAYTLTGKSGSVRKSSSNENTVLARVCFEPCLDTTGGRGYLKDIDFTKIVSVCVLDTDFSNFGSN